MDNAYEAVRECPFPQTLHYIQKNYPGDVNYIPAVKIFACLDLDGKSEFSFRHLVCKTVLYAVQSQLYVALDQQYITKGEFQDVYDHTGRTRVAIRGFIKHLPACK